MTEEQERAIKYLEKQINYFKEQIKFIEAVDCDYYDEEYKLYKNRVKQFETVLNMLKEKDAEIEQKNEVLNRVYDFIWENDCCRYFSKKHALCNQVLNFDSCLGNCKRNCIKQYFERKATNNS